MIFCNNCQHSTELEIELNNMWHGDPSAKHYIFSQNLFIFYDLLKKHQPGLSELGFIRSLEMYSKSKGRVSKLHACESYHHY